MSRNVPAPDRLQCRTGTVVDQAGAEEQAAREFAVDAEWRRAVMESIPDCILLFDAEGVVIEINQAFEDLFGYSMADGPLRPPYPWWPTPEEDADGLRELEAFFEAIQRGAAPNAEFVFYNRERTKIWTRSSGAAIHHPHLGTTNLRIIRDVTRERQAQRRRAAAADVGQTFAATDDLAALIGIAEHGFELLFDGECTIQLGAGEERQWFNSRHLDYAPPLPRSVQVGLDGEPNADPHSLRTGILLVPTSRAVPCRAWVQFPRMRPVTVDEMVTADLLAAAFAGGLERLTARSEATDQLANLFLAVESHRLVGQATGILVERHRILPGDAFERLRKASQHRNVRVRDLAAHMIESGLDPEVA